MSGDGASNNGHDANGPDLTTGVAIAELPDGAMVLGHVRGEPVLLARHGTDFFAVDAMCTHYGGPLAEGLLVDDTVRCPWHHACFSLRTGEAVRAPALKSLSCWRVDQDNGTVRVDRKLAPAATRQQAAPSHAPASVIIVGGGAAGHAAAEALRKEGYSGRVTMLSADDSAPYDRPNLSKDYLAGSAPEEWIPLRPLDFYKDHDIDLRLHARVAVIDARNREVQLHDGQQLACDALLLATGAEPVRLAVPGADRPSVHYLRSLADSRTLVATTGTARRAVIVGASFIGLEVAASLRARNLAVDVVAPEARPMERIMGSEMGDFIRSLHEAHGVAFHLGTTVASIDDDAVRLANGEILPADLVVAGIGVRPAIGLAERAGLTIDRGVLVNEYLETSAPGIFAAGDVARWPDRLTGEPIRVEHWVVAERQGQTAARNMLGQRERFGAVPFFWSQHYDVAISYVGHAEHWDRIDIDGSVQARDCAITYWHRNRKLAIVTISRDQESLRAEVAFEARRSG
jgi:NADPH-dependent 2,4-dienoyl-CoA reductase/sulfur reductase-like enzyme/nitrite reductase/ring-hydroxylating ferredoxin subunit